MVQDFNSGLDSRRGLRGLVAGGSAFRLRNIATRGAVILFCRWAERCYQSYHERQTAKLSFNTASVRVPVGKKKSTTQGGTFLFGAPPWVSKEKTVDKRFFKAKSTEYEQS